jgi:hypothetical protein
MCLPEPDRAPRLSPIVSTAKLFLNLLHAQSLNASTVCDLEAKFVTIHRNTGDICFEEFTSVGFVD